MNRTEITENNMSFLMGEERTPQEIVEFLKTGARFREFPEVLKGLYPGEGLAEKLADGMAAVTGEEYSSVARKVRNWMKGRNMPGSRETLFQICFVLGMDEHASNVLLAAASDTFIHYRNPEELAYAFALRTHMEYREAQGLRARAKAVYEAAGGSRAEWEGRKDTVQIRDSFRVVQTEEGFLDFLRENVGQLGMLHETAYREFLRLYGILQQPESITGDEVRKYSVEMVVDEYLRMKVPQGKKLAGYSALQNLVKKHWPNETSLQNMLSRKEEVGRKVMILLYLVTEEFDSVGRENMDEDNYFPDMEEDPDECLEARIEVMDMFLHKFGMNGMDPGNPFDYMALYAMHVQMDVEEPVSSRMDAVLSELYGNKLQE